MTVIHGDCLDVLKTLADNSVDAVVTDPPYGLSFMGKKWDYDVPSVEIWAECLRVLKPGGHLLAFAGTRTQHRMAVRIEDAGFEIRDMIAWVYGSGFPKSHNVSIAIDKINGRPNRGKALVVAGRGDRKDIQGKDANPRPQDIEAYIPATEAARQWQGWGTALKPALEPITVARKPLIGTVAENVLAHGTGGLNIDGCRVATPDGDEVSNHGRKPTENGWDLRMSGGQMAGQSDGQKLGRWPANLIHDGGEEVLACFPDTKGGVAVRRNSGGNTFGGDKPKPQMDDIGYGDSGSAARFFYCAKASKRDRDEGLDGFDSDSRRMFASGGRSIRDGEWVETDSEPRPRKNNHPTVKPTDLMRYLCRLVTPPNGIILDPFTGSGSTGKAAVLEGFQFIGIEREAEYVEIAKARIANINKGLFA